MEKSSQSPQLKHHPKIHELRNEALNKGQILLDSSNYDPKTEVFKFGYSIPLYCKNVKLFENYQFPLCLQQTLFLEDQNTKRIRNGQLAGALLISNKLKSEGSLFYADGNISQAIDFYNIVFFLKFSSKGIFLFKMAKKV